MKDAPLEITTVLILSLLILGEAVDGDVCHSPQFIKIGTAGKIKCSFPKDVYGVFWYNSTDPLQDSVILISEDSIKKGEGFLSGEFDLSYDGSLIVQNVSMRHEGSYTVVVLLTPTSKARSFAINVFVTAITFSHFPEIQNCNNIQLCFQILDGHSQLTCTVKDFSRPVSLFWVARTLEGDRNVSSHSSVTLESQLFFTSRVTTSDFSFTPVLILLVCKAETAPGLLERNETLVLVQKDMVPTTEPDIEYLEIDSKLILSCSVSNISYLVWQRMDPSDKSYYNIMYAVFVGTNIVQSNFEGYQLKNRSSLVVETVRVEHEGLYRCISGNGLEDAIKVYNAVVFVPSQLAVDGCSGQKYCILEGTTEGSLACILKGVRPYVELDFTELPQGSSEEIQFYDKTLTRKVNGDTFDVVLNSRYRYNGLGKTKVAIECQVIGTNIGKLQLSRIFDIWFEHGTGDVSPSDGTTTTIVQVLWIILSAVVLSLFVLCCVVFITAIRRRTRTCRYHKSVQEIQAEDPVSNDTNDKHQGLSYKNRKQYQDDCGASIEEIMPMVQRKDPIVAKKAEFVSELKEKYTDICELLQPIPYIRDRLYCVDRVFVEGGIEFLIAKNKIGGEEKWEKLDTYQHILTDDRVKSKRLIIEGDPGYGKSSLALQLAYDWCKKSNLSYLKNFDVLILLRLRQLKKVTSIYRSIRMFLLPKDSQLSETDIEMILRHTSTLVILDGYDEYSNSEENKEDDVFSIITRNMFQKLEVILTTRSSYLPKDYPRLTKRLKLTGFDDKARDQYIRKAVVGDDKKEFDKVKQRLQENDVLANVCQVPLFFVMYAHMTHESGQFQLINSVTKLFRYMISCFHSHMKNKMKDENVRKIDLFVNHHSKLDMIAYDGLSSKGHTIVWRKDDISNLLGKDFYDHYVRVGILLEEEVLDISDPPGSYFSEHIQYTTEVRFYHQIFCEWYAANYLSRCFASEKEGNDHLEQHESENECIGHFLHKRKPSVAERAARCLDCIDPFKYQYVYLFACGLSSEPGANEVIRYLQAKRETSQFVILCTLEQTGNVETIKEYVEYICKEGFAIGKNQSLLLQRSTLQLIKIGSNLKFPISSIRLVNCYRAVDLSSKCINLRLNISLPVLHVLKSLEIWESENCIEKDEFRNILCFAVECNDLQDLTISRCVVPLLNEFSTKIKSVLQSRKVKVYWWPRRRYRLNLISFLWEDMERGMVITEEEYQSEVKWCNSLLENQ